MGVDDFFLESHWSTSWKNRRCGCTSLSETMRNLLLAVAQHGGFMGYRNKTYVAFASEDISKYRLMEAPGVRLVVASKI